MGRGLLQGDGANLPEYHGLGVRGEPRGAECLRLRRDRSFRYLLVHRADSERFRRPEVSSVKSWYSQKAFEKPEGCPQMAEFEEVATFLE